MPHGVVIVSYFIRKYMINFFSSKGKRLAPEYEKAATTLLQNDPPVALVKVNEIDYNS